MWVLIGIGAITYLNKSYTDMKTMNSLEVE